MGNDRTLAMIAKAAAKLAKLDPDYALNILCHRREVNEVRRREAVHALAREFNRDFSRIVRSVEAETTFDPLGDIESITAQDALIVSLDTVIGVAPLPSPFRVKRQQKSLPSTERRKRQGQCREARRHTYNGKSLTLRAWAIETGICLGTINNRLRQGWSLEAALTVKVGSIMGGQAHIDRRGCVGTCEDAVGTSGAASRDTEPKQDFLQSAKS